MQNKFYGSKLNTILLLVLIGLMIIALKVMLKKSEIYFLQTSQNQTNQISAKEWKTYKNDELGISFQYPKKYDPITVNFENGSEGGRQFRGYFDSLGTVFGGLSKDYAAGRDGSDFTGYISALKLKDDLGFDQSKVATKQFEEIVTNSGASGVRVQDLHDRSEDGFGIFIYPGETAYFFNLPKLGGGMEMKFNREKIPEYKEIIQSLVIYQ